MLSARSLNYVGREDGLHSIHLVHLRSPKIAASRWVIRGPDYLIFARLQSLEGGRPGDLDILVCRGRQVVEAIDVDDVWVTAQRPLQRVRKVGCM